MSDFANMIRTRLAAAQASDRLVNPDKPTIEGPQGEQALGAGLTLVQRLVSQNVACAQDDDCKEVASILQVASTGTPADTRTALTRLQCLLSNLTAADSDVAGDSGVQTFRQHLHLALDH